MTIDRAIEILNPEHREHYDGMDEVNEACQMGMEALKALRSGRWKRYSTTMMECSLCGKHTARHRFNYCPNCGAKMDLEGENCTWATAKEQANNRRNTVRIKHMGENRTVGEWAEALGMSRSTISSRYYRGLPIEKVLAKENLRCHA